VVTCITCGVVATWRQARRPNVRSFAIVSVVALALNAGMGALAGSAAAAAGSTTASHSSTSSGSGSSKGLSLPKTSYSQDTKYLTDVAEADLALATYEQKQGNVALRTLLTDGSAFCALLKRAKDIDEALVAEADGARSTETQTSLPLSVTTFNTIEAVALVTLCPSELKLVPKAARSRIRSLGARLATRPG
jgi:hypothetical protein